MQRRRRLAAAWSLMGSGALVLAGGGALALPSLIHAAPSYVVTNCTTSNTNGAGKTPVAGDLEWAVDQADTTPGTITFNCAAGSTIAVVDTLDVSNTMTINGLSTDGKTPVILDGGNRVQLFYARGAATDFTLEHLTLQNGSASAVASGFVGGAISFIGAALTLTDDTFAHNTALTTISQETGGGAVYIGTGTTSITNTTFEGNSAGGSSNFAALGGALLIGSSGAITITGSTFKGNSATTADTGGTPAFSLGGAIALEPFGPGSGTSNLAISSSTFEDNSVAATSSASSSQPSISAGGAVFVMTTGTTAIQSGTLFEKNTASASGATPYATGGALQFGFPQGAPPLSAITVDHSTLIDNTASATITGGNSFAIFGPYLPNSGGGALYDVGSPLTLTNSTIGGNTASTTLAKGATATSALSYGGGLVAEGNPTGPSTIVPALITIDDSTISGNSVSEPLAGSFPTGALGGGVMNYGDTLTLTRATIAQNAVSGTTDSYGGGLASVFGATTTVGASILAESTATTGPDCYFQASTETDLGYNLESGTDCFGATPATGDKQNVSNPGLASKLANNGGPTETLALLAGSPAIDAIPDPTKVTVKGSTTTYNLCPGTPASDQRGVARPQGAGCDIGAYEYQKPTPSTGLSGNGAPHTPITAQVTSHPNTLPGAPKLPSSASLPKLPKFTPQQPVVGSAVVHSPQQSSFPLALAALLAILGFALLGSGALVLGRARKTDGR